MANVKSIINLINSNNATWNRVNNQPCMHTFIGDFYINLCLYNRNNVKTIAIDVDDIKKGISDLLAEDVQEGDNLFNDLYVLYSSTKEQAKNIAMQG